MPLTNKLPYGFPLHCIIYGDAGAKKSTCAATFPKPMLVLSFDPFGKELPYLRRGRPGDRTRTDAGYFITPVWHAERDEVSIMIEHFVDPDPEQPTIWGAYLSRMHTLVRSGELTQWKTVVFDSLTFMEFSARMWDKYKANKGAKDGRQHYGASKDAVELQVLGRASAFPCNVVAIAHVDEEKDDAHGGMIYNPAAPGKLSKRLPAGFTELYRAFVKTENGKNDWLLQTEKSSLFNASSQIPAPDPCPPDYRALWTREE